MPRFTPIGFYDLSTFFAAYTAVHKAALIESASPRHRGARSLDLLNDRERSPILDKWKSASALLQRVEARMAALPKPAELMNAYVLALDPDGYEQWNLEDIIDPDGFMRIHIALHPAPALRLHSGNEVCAPAPWTAFAVDHRVPVSQTNFDAPAPAHQLIFELALDVEG